MTQRCDYCRSQQAIAEEFDDRIRWRLGRWVVAIRRSRRRVCGECLAAVGAPLTKEEVQALRERMGELRDDE
jgi:hypothetical protein